MGTRFPEGGRMRLALVELATVRCFQAGERGALPLAEANEENVQFRTNSLLARAR